MLNSVYAQLLQQTGKPGAAVKRYIRTAEERPAFREARFRAGILLFELGRFREASGHLAKTLEPEDAETPRYLYALAMAQGAGGDPSEAVNSLQHARELAVRFGQHELAEKIEGDLNRLGASK